MADFPFHTERDNKSDLFLKFGTRMHNSQYVKKNEAIKKGETATRFFFLMKCKESWTTFIECRAK